jgi:hypothetical protein
MTQVFEGLVLISLAVVSTLITVLVIAPLY